MTSKIKNPWGDGRDADVSDSQCCARPCLHVGEDKGTFVQGRGYTSYHKNPKLVCMTRQLNGCPFPKPEPEPEQLRCCHVPDFPKPRKGSKPSQQKCRTCGTNASGWLLEQRRDLPALEHVECKHRRAHKQGYSDLFGCTLWVCSDCNLYWERDQPSPKQPGQTYRELLDARFKS